MKRRVFWIATLAILCTLLTVSALAATDTVYLDGTGATEGAYTDLKSAVSALPNGGTVIVSGDTTVGTASAGVTLAKVGGKVTVTSEKGAVLTIARSLTLASEMEFNNITLNSPHTSNGRIIANGNKITIGENVVTVPASNDRYPSIIGGMASGTCKGSHVVIKSGTWFVVFGASYGGSFIGDSIVDFTGGTIKAVLTGGNRAGNFTGNATLNIGGDAVIEYNKDDENADYMGVIGGSMGLKTSSTAYTFKGDIAINISGNAQSAANILGGSRYSHITTEGDITITVGGNAKLTRNIYAGGYEGGITTGENGIRVILKDNATIGTNVYVCAGSLNAGTPIVGDGYVEFRDNAKLTGALYAGGYSGSFTGNTSVAMYGGTVTSTVSAQSRGGSVSRTQTVTLYGGNAGPVKGDVTIDLAADASVEMKSCDGAVTTVVPDGYEAVVDGTTYTARLISTEPEPTTVYVDGTNTTAGAYATFEEGFAALADEGGTIIISGHTALGTSSKGVTLPAKNGKVTVRGENDATLYFARSLRVACDLEIDDLHIHSTILSSLSAVNNIIMQGNTLTIGDGVTMTKDASAIWPAIIGGQDASTTYDTYVTVKAGTWQNIYAGGYSGTFAGKAVLEVTNATVVGTLSASNRAGTFSGTAEMTFDLREGKTVTAGTFVGTPTLLTDDGYEGVLVGSTYLQRIPVDMTPKTVYLDGTGKTEGAYTTFAEALAAMPGGGTIVVCGNIRIETATTLSTGGELLITSIYNGVDYTDSAAIQVADNIILGTATTLKDIVLEKAATGDDYIIANGNALTIDENVFCRNTLATRYITIIGGALSGTFEGDSDITIKSGYFRNVFGGNYNGTFKGNSHVTITGGYFDNSITGGTFMGNFEGDAHVNIGGDAVFVYVSTAQGVVGSCLGSGTDAYTFVGDIYINLYDSARINNGVYGGSRYSNVTTTGNVTITVKDDAFVYQNLYAGGYAGTLNGNTKVVMDDGWVGVNLAGGSRGGTVNGDTYVEINGGKVNYYATNIHSSVSDVAGEYNVAGGGLTGAVNGNTEVVISGGDIYGNVYGGGITTGTVSGNSTVTLMGGSIWCGAYADGATAGAVGGTKTLNIDLSDGGSLSLGLSADVKAFTGGGTLTLFPEAVITTDSFSGAVTLDINGVPQARAYITATETDNASVTYTVQDGEVFAETVGDGATVYGVTSAGYHATTRVIFKHHPGVQIYPRAGLVTTGDRMTATLVESERTVFDFAPGLYNYVVYHTQEDYKRKYIYITGKEEEITLDLTNYTPMVGEGFEAAHFYENTEEIYETFYNTDDLIGYAEPDSPYFTNNRYGQRLFTSNAELVEFVNAKVASCDYAYAYDLFTSSAGNTMPLVLFTKDDIPADATLTEAAKIVSATKGRDVLMVTAIVHGNEPSGGEGALAMISELCGAYGDTLLTGNVGAVIIIPRLNPDGCDAFTRETPNGVTVDSGKNINNLNRDYAMLTSAEISGVAHAFDLFAPTILVDCHEAGLSPQWGDSNTLTDIYDVGVMSAGTLNTPFADAAAAIRGDYANRGMRVGELLTEVLEGIEETGLRAYYYQTPMTFPANNSPYGLTNGAYTFLVEVPGISGGDAVYARRVFAHLTALKEIFALAAESDGQLAKEVNAAREAVALSAQVFDVDTPIVLQHNYTRHDSATLLWNNPFVGADATVRREENITKYYLQDIAIKYRVRPTAYAVSADASGIGKVLAALDTHGIRYALLGEDTTLTLKQYSGDATTATLSAAKEVTFANGVYLIPVDGYKAYLIASLFEPECPDSGEEISTFVQAGYLAASDIYRSEENYIAAKLGIAGTYYAVGAAKTVESVIADGEAADVITDGGYAIIKTPAVNAVITYTDGSTETVWFDTLPGDINADGEVSVTDALLLLRAILNDHAVENGDLNGDGRLGMVDVIRILKYCVA